MPWMTRWHLKGRCWKAYERPSQISYDFMRSENQDASRCQSWRCVPSQASWVPVPVCTMQKEVAQVEKQEMPVMSDLDDAFGAGLILLHAPTRLWRPTSCLLEHGLDFQGSKICWIDCWGTLPGLRYPHQRKTSELCAAFDLAPLCRPFSGTPRWFQSLVVVRSHVVLRICTCHVWTVAGGTSVKGSNIWQTCYDSHESWWVMSHDPV